MKAIIRFIKINYFIKDTLFLIRELILRLFGFVFCLLIPKNQKYIMMCCRYGKKDSFLHNTKYLFLYLNSIKSDYKTFWLCDDKEQIKIFNKYGYKNVFPRNSIKGIYYSLRSKYWLHNFLTSDLPQWCMHNAISINLWHGIPLKKICHDVQSQPSYKQTKKYIFETINDALKLRDRFIIVSSEYEKICESSGFREPLDKFKILGSPRNDVLLKDIPNTEIFLEKDFQKIKEYKEQGKKMIIYMPTFRDTGINISGWLNSEALNNTLQKNNIILICKLHPYAESVVNISSSSIYKMECESDIYSILKYSDALLTDYSSVYFDYLLLDKPIIYYPMDLKRYEEERGFYAPYDELTAGVKVYNENELLKAIENIANDIDNYKKDRESLRNRMFKYQDGNNCQRIVEFINSLNKKIYHGCDSA